MRVTRKLGAVLGAAALVVGLCAAPATSQVRAIGHTRVFATVPPPGHPGGILLDGDTVYVNTFNPVFRPLDGYDAIFALDARTGLLRTDRPNPIAVPRRVPATIMGLAGMAIDAHGRLYVSDMTGRVVRVDPATGARETYATFPTDSKTSVTGMPGDLVFADDGTLYVTDTSVPIIWRVAPGGGMAEAFLVDPLRPSVWAYGFAGIALDAAQEHIYFAGHTGPAATVFRVPVSNPVPTAVEIVRVYEPRGLFGSADLAFGASGKLYVVLLGAGQISVLNPDGSEAARIPSAAQAAAQTVPWDDPLFLAFDGKGSLLVTNSGFSTPENGVVFDVWVGDTALPGSKPSLPPSSSPDGQGAMRMAGPDVPVAIAMPLSCSLRPAAR